MSFDSELIASLDHAGLAPGKTPLIPENFKPSKKLDITYGDKPAAHGSFLKTGETKEAPSISFVNDGSSKYFLLLMVDPDAPTRENPKFAYWRHWVLPGLQASKDGTVTLCHPALTEYLGPGPKEESAAPHRYLFLLFNQPDSFKLSKLDFGGEEFVDRRSFKAPEFIEKHDLRLIAVNWFSGVGDSWRP